MSGRDRERQKTPLRYGLDLGTGKAQKINNRAFYWPIGKRAEATESAANLAQGCESATRDILTISG
jgi:hypothetical protein